jgi:hypothetical protein
VKSVEMRNARKFSDLCFYCPLNTEIYKVVLVHDRFER